MSENQAVQSFKAQLLKVYVQKGKDDPNKEYPKVILYNEDWFQKSPSIGIRPDDFIELKLNDKNVVQKLIQADECIFQYTLNFWDNNATISINKIIPVIK